MTWFVKAIQIINKILLVSLMKVGERGTKWTELVESRIPCVTVSDNQGRSLVTHDHSVLSLRIVVTQTERVRFQTTYSCAKPVSDKYRIVL